MVGNFHSVQKETFSSLINLEELNIIQTNITHIPSGLLAHNGKLKAVRFNQNFIGSVPFDAFGETNSVSLFHFNYNQVQVIFKCKGYIMLPEIAEDFTSLKELSLRGLQINESTCPLFSSKFFEPLSDSLVILDLGESNLFRMNRTDDALKSLENLETLFLRTLPPFWYCPGKVHELLECLPSTIQSLDLMRWENVGSFNNSCIYNSTVLSALTELNLTSLSFRYSDFAFGSALGSSALPFLSSLTRLDLGYCRLLSVSGESLSRLTNLEVLDLDGNPLGYRVYSYDPQNSLSKHLAITTLSLQRIMLWSGDDKFNLIPLTQFFGNVKTLDLTENYLRDMPTFTCVNNDGEPEQCIVQGPEGEKIQIPTSLVTELIMDKNELTHFSKSYPNDDICVRFPALKFLSLAHNRLESIEGLCPQLVKLDLGFNNLPGDDNTTLDIIRNQSSLEILDLSRNDLQKLETTLLQDMVNLTIFKAADNQIPELPDDFFCNNLKLKEIDLSSNLIAAVSTAIFSHLSELEELSLERNHISTFSPEFILYIDETPSIDTIDLCTNPIDCSCNNDYFQKWLYTTGKVQDIKKLTCSSPESLAGTAVYKYDDDYFDCVVKVPLYITMSAVAGFMLTILLALPCYKYRWYILHAKVVYRAIKESLKNIRFEHKCEFDAYISYNCEDGDDSSWVETRLIPAIQRNTNNIVSS